MKAILLVFLFLAGCASASGIPADDAVQCTFRPNGEDVFVDCSNGSHFQAPISGGPAYGFDHRGNDLNAYVLLQDGRYSIRPAN